MSEQIKHIAVLFSVLLNVGFVAAYGYHRFGAGPPSTAGSSSELPLEEELGLSSDQRREFVASRQEFFDLQAEAGQEIKERQLELMDLIAQEPPDMEAIVRKQDEIRGLQRHIQTAVVGHLVEESALLRPDQRRLFFGRLKARIEESDRPRPPWLGALGDDVRRKPPRESAGERPTPSGRPR